MPRRNFLPVEAANVLRKGVFAGVISDDVATLAHGDFEDLSIELLDYQPFASRVWELRHNLSTYDAWYVAVAESLEAPLATLDSRLTRANGPRCEFMTPED
ncbi:MAG: type II toxin-antitoxin system VapC family toxin [Actinobacteria bacterium]|nr:type II toxin-antitoxin system VapC family toxin [Actinomycetota bacterium]